ncbi:hypothetical protein ACLE20_04315 [Rhizobium sp. YIM 134829]|uniref:hypothetical protein n=1 Tax=Rhizobium sp. YIM 134829 TaxID=3390453 RepID=UPI00397D98FC
MALVWLLAAVLAMPIVASAQLVAARIAAEGSASRRSAPETGAIELPSARQALRAVPAAELRFLADRTDGKPLPAGPDPFLVSQGHRLTLDKRGARPAILPDSVVVTPKQATPEARAPPTIG